MFLDLLFLPLFLLDFIHIKHGCHLNSVIQLVKGVNFRGFIPNKFLSFFNISHLHRLENWPRDKLSGLCGQQSPATLCIWFDLVAAFSAIQESRVKSRKTHPELCRGCCCRRPRPSKHVCLE